jgi:hypothetical protein
VGGNSEMYCSEVVFFFLCNYAKFILQKLVYGSADSVQLSWSMV